MKNKIVFCLAVFLLYNLPPSYAAFPVKNKEVPASFVINASETGRTPAMSKKTEEINGFIASTARLLHIQPPACAYWQSHDDTLGMLSMIFGLAGILFFWLGGTLFLGLPAFILGIMGKRRHETYAGIGFGLGLAELILSLSIIAAFFLIAAAHA